MKTNHDSTFSTKVIPQLKIGGNAPLGLDIYKNVRQ